MRKRRKLATTAGVAVLVAAALPLGSTVDAADHHDAPGSTDDPFADINDLYAWHTDQDTIVVVLTFNGLLAPDAPEDATFNADELPNVLYTVHIDNNSVPLADPADWADQSVDSFDSDIDIHVRFGQNALGEWGVQVENLPGAAEPIVGPVGTTLGEGNIRATAGVFDDPFFFDLDGFQATIANLDDDTMDTEADLAFRSLLAEANNDTFAGLNTMAIVLEMDATAALGGNADNYIQLWATTGRAPAQ